MFHYFTIKFHFSFFASYAYFRFTWVIFASKRNKAKQNSSLFFCFFSLFFALFSFFWLFFALNFSLRFDLVIFASKRNKAKQNSSLFFRFFAFFPFFRFFHFFSLKFCFTSIFSLKFRLVYLRFRFRFLVFRIEVNHVKSDFLFASKWNEIFSLIVGIQQEVGIQRLRAAGPPPLHRRSRRSWTIP